MDDRLPVTGEMADATVPAAPTAIDESDAAYRRISGEMAAFYTPAPSCGNTEVEALKEQVAALQSQLDAERQQPDPLELAEIKRRWKPYIDQLPEYAYICDDLLSGRK